MNDLEYSNQIRRRKKKEREGRRSRKKIIKKIKVSSASTNQTLDTLATHYIFVIIDAHLRYVTPRNPLTDQGYLDSQL